MNWFFYFYKNFKNAIMKKNIVYLILISLIISLGFKFLDDRDDFELIKNLEIYHNVLKQLHYNYVDQIDSRSLITTSIDKMLEQLDPYTVYYPESDIESIRIISEAQYTGIGISIDTFENNFYITDIDENSEADKSGVKVGDLLKEVNGISAENKDFDDIHNLITGQIGKNVNLKILRDNKILSFSVTRQTIDLNVVSLYEKLDNFGYIKLDNFSDKSFLEFKTAYLKLKDQKINGLIIDLRNNPGGLLDQAVQILNLFISKDKVVVTSKGKSENSNITFITTQNPDDTKIPIVVLINENSASASEILAGTIQDYDRGIIIGQDSYGKGLVQQIFDLGYNSKIKITISKYYIPSGRCIQAIDYSHNLNNKIDKNAKFYTSRGRIVYEGNGISPDLYIQTDTLDKMLKTFVDKFVIFRFCNYYFPKIDSIDWVSPQAVAFTNFDLFWKYSVENNYLDYLDEFRYLSNLEKSIEKGTQIFTEIQTLKKLYEKDIREKILKNNSELGIFISRELVKRKYYQKGEILFNLKYDTEIQKAKEILSQKSEYNKILNR